MRAIPAAIALLISAFSAASCVGAADRADPAGRYTVNVVTPAEVAIGNNEMTRTVNRNTTPGEADRIIAANPGLAEAIARNGVDRRRIATVRVRPTGVADIFLKAE